MPNARVVVRGHHAAIASIWFGCFDHLFGYSCNTTSDRNGCGDGAGKSIDFIFVHKQSYQRNQIELIVTSKIFGQKGPVFPNPLKTPADIRNLTFTGVAERLSYVGEAINKTRHTINGNVPLLGFSGAPVCNSILRQMSNHIWSHS